MHALLVLLIFEAQHMLFRSVLLYIYLFGFVHSYSLTFTHEYILFI